MDTEKSSRLNADVKIETTIDDSVVEAALAPAPEKRPLPDPDLFPSFADKPY